MAKTEEYEQVIFKRVFNENREMLERIAYFSVRDKEAAKDIVSSAFLKMWEMRGTLDTGRLLPYIYVAVRNACINWRRDSATHHDIFENIRRREKSAMEFYTKAIESCNPAELYVEDILSICRERLEQLPPPDKADLYQKQGGWNDIQGDCRSPRHICEESGQQHPVRPERPEGRSCGLS